MQIACRVSAEGKTRAFTIPGTPVTPERQSQACIAPCKAAFVYLNQHYRTQTPIVAGARLLCHIKRIGRGIGATRSR